MKNMMRCIVAAIAACMLAVCVGCAPAASGSASASGSGSGSGSAAASSASASSAGSQSSAVIDAANLADGEYTIEVTMEGGSGRASIESPAKLNVRDGKMTAVIVWSSSNYDQMVVDGQDYWPVPRPGNSTFEIPVAALDVDMPVSAETTAMSEPHMIDYTFHFDSSTLK